jgi:hypothetical protein
MEKDVHQVKCRLHGVIGYTDTTENGFNFWDAHRNTVECGSVEIMPTVIDVDPEFYDWEMFDEKCRPISF